jgi:hypothetical protein
LVQKRLVGYACFMMTLLAMYNIQREYLMKHSEFLRTLVTQFRCVFSLCFFLCFAYCHNGWSAYVGLCA